MKTGADRNWFAAGFIITAGLAVLYLQFGPMEILAPWEPAAVWAKVVFFPALVMGRAVHDHILTGVASFRTTVYLSGAVGVLLMSLMAGFLMICFRHLVRRR